MSNQRQRFWCWRSCGGYLTPHTGCTFTRESCWKKTVGWFTLDWLNRDAAKNGHHVPFRNWQEKRLRNYMRKHFGKPVKVYIEPVRDERGNGDA